MLKQSVSAAVVALVFCAPVATQVQGAPILAGKYVFTDSQNCTKNDGTEPTYLRATGLATANSGTVSLSEFIADGSPPVLHGSSGSTSYSTSNTTITIGGITYQAYYVLKKGKAIYVSYIGVVARDANHTCAEQGELSQ